jgi:hypothetical protein
MSLWASKTGVDQSRGRCPGFKSGNGASVVVTFQDANRPKALNPHSPWLYKPRLRSWHCSFRANVFGFQDLIENSLRTYLAPGDRHETKETSGKRRRRGAAKPRMEDAKRPKSWGRKEENKALRGRRNLSVPPLQGSNFILSHSLGSRARCRVHFHPRLGCLAPAALPSKAGLMCLLKGFTSVNFVIRDIQSVAGKPCRN